ncbi:MAG TPA: TMEM175 family protein, partial [Steroidobacteraceae bacterium]
MSSPDTARLEAFSDGVFAIAITLLVLEIKVPGAAEIAQLGGLWPALARRWPSYVGYGISFLIIGITWANHHALFQYIRRVDRPLLLASLLLLMGVGFLPFPKAVLAQHLGDEAVRTQAKAFYGATLVFTSITYNLLWWIGRWHGRLRGPEQP